MDEAGDRTWPIGELARAAGVSVRTLRHYEAVGLLVPAERSDGGRRLYDAAGVARLRRIVALRELGFGLQAIARMLESDDPGSLLELIRRQLERIEVDLAVAQRLRMRLQRVAEALERGTGSIDELIDETEVPNVSVKLDRIYTRLGDAGETMLGDMTRVKKTHPLIETGGALDELVHRSACCSRHAKCPIATARGCGGSRTSSWTSALTFPPRPTRAVGARGLGSTRATSSGSRRRATR